MAFFTEILIECVKKNPILYNFDHPDYKNIGKRDKTWKRIALELDADVDQIKKKWKNVRDSYGKYLKSKKSNLNGRGKHYKRWQWADMMEPLLPFMPYYVKPEPNGTDPNESTDTRLDLIEHQSDSDMEDPPNENTDMDIGKPIIADVWSEYSTASVKRSASIDDAIVYQQMKGHKNELTSTEMIFLGYAHTIQKFAPKRQVLAKLKVAEVIMEQELINLEESLKESTKKKKSDISEQTDKS